MDQDTTWYEGRPRPGDTVLDGEPAPLMHGKGHSSLTFRPMSIVTERSPISTTAELLFWKWKLISSVTDEHHLVPLWRSCDSGVAIQVLGPTYLTPFKRSRQSQVVQNTRPRNLRQSTEAVKSLNLQRRDIHITEECWLWQPFAGYYRSVDQRHIGVKTFIVSENKTYTASKRRYAYFLVHETFNARTLYIFFRKN